jgi:hypothetical protein
MLGIASMILRDFAIASSARATEAHSREKAAWESRMTSRLSAIAVPVRLPFQYGSWRSKTRPSASLGALVYRPKSRRIIEAIPIIGPGNDGPRR